MCVSEDLLWFYISLQNSDARFGADFGASFGASFCASFGASHSSSFDASFDASFGASFGASFSASRVISYRSTATDSILQRSDCSQMFSGSRSGERHTLWAIGSRSLRPGTRGDQGPGSNGRRVMSVRRRSAERGFTALRGASRRFAALRGASRRFAARCSIKATDQRSDGIIPPANFIRYLGGDAYFEWRSDIFYCFYTNNITHGAKPHEVRRQHIINHSNNYYGAVLTKMVRRAHVLT